MFAVEDKNCLVRSRANIHSHEKFMDAFLFVITAASDMFTSSRLFQIFLKGFVVCFKEEEEEN